MQVSGVASTADGDTLEHGAVAIITIAEEDGELKVLEVKEFCDPKKRNDFHIWAAKTLAKHVA